MNIKTLIAKRRKWLAENSIEDWTDADTNYIANQIAQLTWDAAHRHGYIQGIINYDPTMPQKNQYPGQETFIKQLFGEEDI